MVSVLVLITPYDSRMTMFPCAYMYTVVKVVKEFVKEAKHQLFTHGSRSLNNIIPYTGSSV